LWSRGGIKRKPSVSIPPFELDIIVALPFPSTCFFGQTATKQSPLSALFLAKQVLPLSSSAASRRSSEQDREKNPSLHRQPWLISWKCSSHFAGRW
jgi:hypothetical protein